MTLFPIKFTRKVQRSSISLILVTPETCNCDVCTVSLILSFLQFYGGWCWNDNGGISFTLLGLYSNQMMWRLVEKT